MWHLKRDSYSCRIATSLLPFTTTTTIHPTVSSHTARDNNVDNTDDNHDNHAGDNNNNDADDNHRWVGTTASRKPRIPVIPADSSGFQRNGTGIHRNPQEWDRNLQEWDWNRILVLIRPWTKIP
ncbi:uncharacterized protein LACBIDRAFT_321174 [Laccaria bicolor S238N-H82]|uniref:Predicted protein n=1 Tax=Laccaria bicolor (strain S238N-H82 / ATCC MYA-4686) TaxID=486041 RepID=B0CNZ8_LACBS|nr:uncharacterized protein LACBIDRAFT_321174 [Laccaria bicolor S238N-H82]EDR15384.1 predicted protein [Laccaria bicolor S238N-H82]|eukprot:XP_001873592.1 predicted protein [Laccaria bicolor S238N-H82]